MYDITRMKVGYAYCYLFYFIYIFSLGGLCIKIFMPITVIKIKSTDRLREKEI